MIKVFVIGHGVMAANPHAFTTLLKHQLTTYVKDGKMFDSNGSSGVVDGGGYAPAHASSQGDAATQTFTKGQTIPTHWIYSTRMGMFMDLKKSNKMTSATAAVIGKSFIKLLDNGGKVYVFDDDTYVYITEDNVLTSIATMQHQIDTMMGKEPYEIHWTACRSYAEGNTTDEILAYMRDYGADAEGLKAII